MPSNILYDIFFVFCENGCQEAKDCCSHIKTQASVLGAQTLSKLRDKARVLGSEGRGQPDRSGVCRKWWLINLESVIVRCL